MKFRRRRTSRGPKVERNPREPLMIEQCIGCGGEVTVWNRRQLTPEGDPLCPRCRRVYREENRAERASANERWEQERVERESEHERLLEQGVCPGPLGRFDDLEREHEVGVSPLGVPYCHVCFEQLEDDEDLEPNPEDDDEILDLVEVNPRPLGDRPSMDTKFGDTLEHERLDALSGAKGRDTDAAMRRYKTFHAKDPIRVAELQHELPSSWKPVGDALAVMYRTDKWKKDGTDEDYKHLHDRAEDKPYEVRRGVRFYEPSSGGTQLPKPKAITLLGYCLGAFVRKDDDGQTYETNPRGCYLFSAPDGKTLYIYSPHKQSDGSSGFLAAFRGGNLRVLKDGIDG